LLGSTPFVLVAIPSLPATSISELLALAKARPLNYASSGNGSPSHLAMEMFRSAARVDIQHIPYKGVAPAMTDLLGGQVMMMFSTVAPALPLIRTGKLRALGMASRIRSATATDVPTIAESGLQGFEASTWFGVLVPTGTPRSVVTSLNAQMTAILRQPATRSRLVAQGFDVIGNSPAEFGAFIKDELARWSQAVKKSGARID
jgi:tripartite-type tricarboxylate transporter receptor subunit TctC